MVNHSGKNGTNNGTFPPDHELKKILFEYARRSLSLNTRLRYLEEDHQIKIGLTKLKELNKTFSVPSARKFTEVEEATTVIADIIARDVFQGQGPDTVKIIASLRLNLTIPRNLNFNPVICPCNNEGLVGQGPSDMRQPGRRKGQKKRSALNAIGIFQEIHGMVMKNSVKRPFAWEQVLWLVVLPNSRLSNTVGHVFWTWFRHLEQFRCKLPLMVVVNWVVGSIPDNLEVFVSLSKEIFAPELSPEEWKPVVAVQSSSNIPIESTWSYDRKFNGRSIREVLEEGRIHLIPGDVVHIDYGLENLAIPVTQEAIDELRALIDTPREDALRWVSEDFAVVANDIYTSLGSPKLEVLSGWAIFNAMAPLDSGCKPLSVIGSCMSSVHTATQHAREIDLQSRMIVDQFMASYTALPAYFLAIFSSN
ncbi:hypothetical protein B0H14DRAFT_2649143 [Mycena olivaceomarginata]|nr:hypothetical protein B0H14DRAFT_2649143 [Mycena olivaceomarginata]